MSDNEFNQTVESSLRRQIKELKAENERLREALKFYASSQWNDDYPGGISVKINDDIYLDTGDKAREALKEGKI